MTTREGIETAQARGWSIIPVRVDKRPAIGAWAEFQRERPTPEQIAQWSKADPPAWAVITGALSGVVILDFDGDAGKETMDRLGIRPHVRTGSGGYHAYYRHPGHRVQTLNSKSKIELGERYPGLDIRADGGYAVFCGRNSSGPYEWLRPAELDALDTIPADVRAYLGLDAPTAAPHPPGAVGAQATGSDRPAQRRSVDADSLIRRALERAGKEGRNNAGFWLACQMRDREASESEAEQAARWYASSVAQTNTKGQHEPYTANEALASVREAYRAPKREAPRNPNAPAAQQRHKAAPADAPKPTDDAEQERHHCTDKGNAYRLARKFKNHIRFCHAWEKWLVWDGERWKIDANGGINRYAMDAAGAIFQEAADRSISMEARDKLIKWAYDSEAANRLANMERLARNILGIAITPDDLDANQFVLNCKNGTVDLRTGKLRPHSRLDLLTKLAPVAFDPNAQAPVWEMFVRQIMLDRPALIGYLQRVIGYALTGAVDAKAIFVLYGHGDNGKTTFLEAVRYVLGDYAGIIPIESLMQSKGSTGREATPELAELKGRRFVTSSEADDGQRLNEARVKNLTGMGRIVARSLYRDPFEFDPTHKLFLDANYKPTVRGQDKGIWTRLKLIPFDLQLKDEQRDRTLLTRLRAEAPGILAWAVRGCLQFQAEGLNEPEEIKQSVIAYRAQMDVLGVFLADCTAPDKATMTRAADLYTVYSAWAKRTGEYVWSERIFSERMVERGAKKARKTRGVFYHDLVLTQQVNHAGKLEGCRDVAICTDSEGSSLTRIGGKESYPDTRTEATSLHSGGPDEEVF